MTAITITPVADHSYSADPAVAWVLEAVDDWMERSQSHRRDPGRFHPSDLTHTDSEIVARYLGQVGESHDPIKLRIFDNGHGMHRRWGRYLKKAGLTVKHPKSFYMPRLKLKGTCDEIIAHPETGEAVVLELKSINPFGFAKLTAPHDAHLDQLHCYLAGLRIVSGVVLYECKGTQAVKLFAVPFDTDHWAGIERRLIRLRREADRIAAAQKPEVIRQSAALAHELGQDVADIRQHPALQKSTFMS